MDFFAKRHFFSPLFDFLCIGGLSFLVYVLVLVLGVSPVTVDIAWWMWLLAFFVNGPHFLISYEIFYGAHGRKILSLPRFFWAGVLVPAVLLGLMVYGFLYESNVVFLSLLYVMFFTVGWHYVKQAYGCFIVYSAGQGICFERWEKYIVRFSLFPLWWASFLSIFSRSGAGDYWGLKYSVPPFLASSLEFLHVLSFSGVVLLLLLFVFRACRGAAIPSLTAMTPLLVIFVWLSPFLKNDFFFYMIPFFHSLQYFLFSGVFTRAKVGESGNGWRGYLIWWGGAFILAAVSFHFAPLALDGLSLHSGELTPNLFFIAFMLFINIHHYFIDNVIWRGDNSEVRKYVAMRG